MKYLFFICLIALAAFLYNNPKTRNAYHSRAHNVYGIDVARYQEQINWNKVENDDIEFAFVKATEGEAYVDPYFQENWAALGTSTIKRGAYHFFRPSIDAHAQATHFIRTVNLQPGDLPPVLDVEVTDKKPATNLVNGVATWLEIVEKHYGVRPIIYSGLNFHTKYLAKHFPHHYVWIASYGWRAPQLEDRQPWLFWQYTDKGRVKGISKAVDINTFNGDMYTLNRLCVPDPNNPFSPLDIPGQTPNIDLGEFFEIGKKIISSPSTSTPFPDNAVNTPDAIRSHRQAPNPANDSLNNPVGIITQPIKP